MTNQETEDMQTGKFNIQEDETQQNRFSMAFGDDPDAIETEDAEVVPNNFKKSMLANMIAAGAKYQNFAPNADNEDSLGSKKSLGNMSLA